MKSKHYLKWLFRVHRKLKDKLKILHKTEDNENLILIQRKEKTYSYLKKWKELKSMLTFKENIG